MTPDPAGCGPVPSMAEPPDDRVIALPAVLASALLDLLDDLSEGRDVTSAPAGLPVGTEVASALLGVSRPWLTTPLDRGEIASVRNGSKRRIGLGDLVAYRRTDNARRRDRLTWDFLHEEQAQLSSSRAARAMVAGSSRDRSSRWRASRAGGVRCTCRINASGFRVMIDNAKTSGVAIAIPRLSACAPSKSFTLSVKRIVAPPLDAAARTWRSFGSVLLNDVSIERQPAATTASRTSPMFCSNAASAIGRRAERRLRRASSRTASDQTTRYSPDGAPPR